MDQMTGPEHPQDRPPQDPPYDSAAAPPPPPEGPADASAFDEPPNNDERTMGMLCHLLGIFAGFLGPLIIWLIKKEESRFVNDQGKEALNFQITVLIAFFCAGVTMCIGVGLVLVPAVGIANLVFCILAAIESNKGVRYRYPLNIRFIK